MQRPARSVREALVGSWPGRILLGSAAVRALVAVVERAVGAAGFTHALGVAASVALVATSLYFLWRLLGIVRYRLLWRVRRRLVVSYILIGVVPSLLIVAFFLFAGLLLFFHVSAYLFKRGVDDIVDEAVVIAETTALELRRARGPDAAADVLERKRENASGRYRDISLALVPRAGAGGGRPRAGQETVTAGEWRHAAPPDSVPEWVSLQRFGGLVSVTSPDAAGETSLVIRAVGFPDERDPTWGVVVDLPLDEQVLANLHEATGIDLRSVGVLPVGDATASAVDRGARTTSQPLLTRQTSGTTTRWAVNSVLLLDHREWQTGRAEPLTISVRVGARDIYERIAAAQSRIGSLSLADLFMAALAAIAIFFLIIEAVAFVMGFALAKTITGSVHQLFEGTERIRRGDFAHRIEIRTRDQLGELSESFNEMTASIESLLRQAEEKRRLEEELRIAREIQMSLLPHGPLHMPGLATTALCVPAREVGGDYYDFFVLGERRLGVLIADVSGKGTSAALYMAELKGLMLSLSKIYHSPRQLLIEVNRIISDNLDSRSFITMTYAVVDLAARTFTYARAGHTPLIHYPAANGQPRTAHVLVPNGLVLGLRIPGIEEKFEQLLEECTLSLGVGDVFVLFTDGITEAMNATSDLFGDGRLQRLVEDHGHLPTDQLRERILREVEAFVGSAEQHDDMTMILLKVEDAP